MMTNYVRACVWLSNIVALMDRAIDVLQCSCVAGTNW